EGTRCTRILVIGGSVVSAVTRVAKDGFHATYDHGRRSTLEAYELSPGREQLAQAACRATGIEVAGVDLVETAAGPCVLEVNHICVDFADRELHGPDAVPALGTWLADRALERVRPASSDDGKPRLRIVTGLRTHASLAKIREV